MLIMWVLFVLLLVISIIYIDDFILISSSFISLFAALSAVTGVIYSNFKSDERNKQMLKNSNNQLIEQLTRDKKETALFKLLETILNTLNDYLKSDGIKWVATAESIKELYEESLNEGEHYYFEFNLVVQNKLYFYFNNLINQPSYFNYLPPNIQCEIRRFNKTYFRVFRQVCKFILLRFEGSLDLIDKFNVGIYEFQRLDKNQQITDYWKFGNYLINNIDSYLLDPIYHNKKFVPEGSETIIVKINEKDFNELEAIINKITYLTYIESLKYGFQEL